QMLSEDKVRNARALEKLNLPRARKAILPLGVFLEDPETHLQAVGSPTYYVTFSPTREQLSKYREIDLTGPEVMQFISEHIPQAQTAEYQLILAEFYPSHYGGNIVIDKESNVLIE